MTHKREETKVVVLCGGRGTRLAEHTDLLPKPMVRVGENPILWHIMKGYESQGFSNFVLCLGYRGEVVRDFFVNYGTHVPDITVNTKESYQNGGRQEAWNVTMVNTGEETLSGLRIRKSRAHLDNDPYFMITYGDGLANVNVDDLIEFHHKKGKLGTITAVHPNSRYGVVETNDQGIVVSFEEKPVLKESRINGGFMVFNREVLEYGLLQKNVMLESVLEKLSQERNLAAYHHNGFWHSMDTHRDYKELNEMWDSGKAEWKTW